MFAQSAPHNPSNDTSSNQQKQQNSTDHQTTKKSNNQQLDDYQYIVKFKELDVKSIFKQFYSVYGPLFVVTHISVSLISLGSFCALTWMFVDPMKIIPDMFMAQMTSTILEGTGTGGKFIAAYAMHKIILPIRLGVTIWTTRRLATRVEFLRKRVEKAKKT